MTGQGACARCCRAMYDEMMVLGTTQSTDVLGACECPRCCAALQPPTEATCSRAQALRVTPAFTSPPSAPRRPRGRRARNPSRSWLCRRARANRAPSTLLSRQLARLWCWMSSRCASSAACGRCIAGVRAASARPRATTLNASGTSATTTRTPRYQKRCTIMRARCWRRPARLPTIWMSTAAWMASALDGARTCTGRGSSIASRAT